MVLYGWLWESRQSQTSLSAQREVSVQLEKIEAELEWGKQEHKMQILDERQENILKEERSTLNELQIALMQFGMADEDRETLKNSILALDDLFLLVIVGEFNSGKSTFINAFLGQRLLKEGVTPTTTQVNILRYGEVSERVPVDADTQIITAPADILKDISIVDTPGTNAIQRRHEAITAHFIPRSDLVLFVTSADRPFTESERLFLERIRDWGKKLVIIVNKIDILSEQDEIDQVQNFIAQNALQLLGITPHIFTVSSRSALLSKLGQNSGTWEKSRFEPLENYVRQTLDQGERVRLKFLNPLGVGLHLSQRYLSIISERLGLLADDVKMLDNVDRQLGLYREDMVREFNFRLSDVENILYEMEQRGQQFFEDTLRIGRIFDLMNKSRIEQEFEQHVIADVPQRIDRKINELIDWIVDQDFRQWQSIMEYLAERRREHQNDLIGDPGTASFNYDRERLIEAVGREASRVVETYDRERESAAIAEGAQTAVAAAAALEVSAVGIGALITALATTAAADITGILLASLVAVLGLFVIPARKRQANEEMHAKISQLRDQLVGSLKTQFGREIDRSLERINNAIAPYTRFVRSERTKMEDTQNKLATIGRQLTNLKDRIETF